jgi:hypothetical protein
MKIELKCENCNKMFTTNFKHRDKKFCNRTCYFEYARKNNLLGNKKDPSVREQRICLQCGSEFTERKKHERTLCSDECRLKWNLIQENKDKRIKNSKKVIIEKYGVKSLFELDEFQKKCRKNFKEKYGVSHPMYFPPFVEKLKTTFRENHLLCLIPKLKSYNLDLLDDYINNKDGNTSRPYNFKCLKCDNVFSSTLLCSGKIPICRKCFPITKNSKLEEIFRDFINELGIKHLDNNRTLLNGKEIDLFLTDYNLGIELNGNYHHSEIYGEKDKTYHFEKLMIATNVKIKLLQIFEDELLLKKEIVFSRIKNILGITENKIFARKCVIKEISKTDSKIFLEKNHLQGDSVDKVRLGLYLNDKLITVITFGKKRNSLGNTSITDEYELLRFAGKINTNIVGGFSRLLKYFIKGYNPSKIITYADSRWSGIIPEDTIYYKNGFKFIHQTPPNYWYVNTKDFLHRFHRFTFRKDVLIKEGFSPDKTEWEIMQEKGFDRIWDCGSMKFEMML